MATKGMFAALCLAAGAAAGFAAGYSLRPEPGPVPVPTPTRDTALEAEVAALRAEVTRLQAVSESRELAGGARAGGADSGREPSRAPLWPESRSSSGKRAFFVPPDELRRSESPPTIPLTDLLAELLEASRSGSRERTQKAEEAIANLGASAAEVLRAALAEAKDPLYRVRLAGLLARAGDADGRRVLLGALTAGARDVRRAAAGGLAQAADASAVPALAKAVREDEDFLVRSLSAAALGKAGTDEAEAALKLSYETEKHAMVRAFSLTALAGRGSPGLLPYFEQILREEKEPDRRATAVAGLGKIGTDSAVTYLESVIVNDPDKSVRNAARREVNRIRGSEVHKVEE